MTREQSIFTSQYSVKGLCIAGASCWFLTCNKCSVKVTVDVIATDTAYISQDWESATCCGLVSNPTCYNYRNLRERFIPEVQTPFLLKMVQILCSAANGDDEQGFDSVPTVNDVLQHLKELCSKCFFWTYFNIRGTLKLGFNI